MGHDPMHDWLDMAAHKLGGDKKAYDRYQRKKKLDKIPRPKYNSDDDYGLWRHLTTQKDDPYDQGGPLNSSDQAPSQDPFGGLGRVPGAASIHAGYLPQGHQHQGLFQHSSQRGLAAGSAGSGNSMYSRRSSRGSQSASQLRSQYSSRHGIQPGSYQRSPSPRSSMYSGHQGAPTVSRPGSQQGSASSREPRRAPTERVKTEMYQLGDMTRTFIEGMVPKDQERNGQ